MIAALPNAREGLEINVRLAVGASTASLYAALRLQGSKATGARFGLATSH
jgi:hypothetical protein